MTLLSIAHDVAYETKGPDPQTIAGNTDPAAQQILRLINKVGTRLMQIYEWNILSKEQSFTSIAGDAQTGAIPSDFNRFIPETMWNRGTNELISGPISPIEWNSLKSQTLAHLNKKFIYRGGVLSTVPELGAGQDITFEYVTENWADTAAGGAPKSSMTIDTDVSFLDHELMVAFTKYEYLKSDGLPEWQIAKQDADDALDRLTGNDMASNNIAVAGDIFSRNSRHFDGAPKASRTYGTYY